MVAGPIYVETFLTWYCVVDEGGVKGYRGSKESVVENQGCVECLALVVFTLIGGIICC